MRSTAFVHYSVDKWFQVLQRLSILCVNTLQHVSDSHFGTCAHYTNTTTVCHLHRCRHLTVHIAQCTCTANDSRPRAICTLHMASIRYADCIRFAVSALSVYDGGHIKGHYPKLGNVYDVHLIIMYATETPSGWGRLFLRLQNICTNVYVASRCFVSALPCLLCEHVCA